ncbi:MAG: hypothetical protein RSC40_09730, partial [Clostridia bacterium]
MHAIDLRPATLHLPTLLLGVWLACAGLAPYNPAFTNADVGRMACVRMICTLQPCIYQRCCWAHGLH